MASSRQLAAILFADIVGYTSLMGENEDRAFQVLDKFKRIALPLVYEHQGTWHKDLGDGALCSFGSALDAVKTAIAILQQFNTGTNIKIRIGIHLGDVTYQNGDVFGDGVNIASRIQGEAAPGGICLSEAVFKNVRNKEGIKATFLGKRRLRNVDGTTKLYQISAPGVETNSVIRRRSISVWKAAVIAVGAGVLAGASGWHLSRQFISHSEVVERYDMILPEEAPLALVGSAPLGIGQRALALSPDGHVLVYVGQGDETTRLYTRSMESYEVLTLEGTEGAYFPFFSPDGEEVGFFSQNYLKKISIDGGTSITLCEVNNVGGAAWLPDGRIFFGNSETNNLSWIYSKGGEEQQLEGNGSKLFFTVISPLGNDRFLASDRSGFQIVSVVNGNQKNILDYGFSPNYLPLGYLSFAEPGRLMVAPFDSENMVINGNIVTAISDLRTERTWGQVAISNSGTLIYVPGISSMESELVLLTPDGNEEVLTYRSDYFGDCRISPDGTKLLLSNHNIGDIHIFDLSRHTNTRLTNDGGNYYGIWAPDSKSIFYNHTSQNTSKIYQINVSGSESPKEILRRDGIIYPLDITSDGNILLYSEGNTGSVEHKFRFLNQERKELLLMPNRALQGLASFSPEDNYLAYTSNESGQSEVYIQPFPPDGERWTISSGGGEEPLWSPNGDKLYYRNGNDWMEVPIVFEPSFSSGIPTLLFHGPYINVRGYSYDIHPDGNRFLLIKPISQIRTSTRIKVVKNWFEEVKGLVKPS
jgi:class 3 adenylate cyclase/Tol biopolymer transport system component